MPAFAGMTKTAVTPAIAGIQKSAARVCRPRRFHAATDGGFEPPDGLGARLRPQGAMALLGRLLPEF